MTTEREAVLLSPVGRSTSRSPARELVRELGPQDWVMLAYLSLLGLVALGVEREPARDRAVFELATLLALVAVAVGLVRAARWSGRGVALLYRVALFGSLFASYSVLGGLLPLLHDMPVDQQLYALDLALFGVEPALAMDAWVSPALTEWMAFFYLSYFGLLAFGVVPALLLTREPRRLTELGLGILSLFCLGHLGYLSVPGFGPYWALPEQFTQPLPSGPCMDLVLAVVTSGGAQMDIFPSLHTALPTLLLLFAYRHRAWLPLRHGWVLLAGFVGNIVLATMYLRWHYLIDVVAGFALALAGFRLSVGLAEAELRRRVGCRTELWPPLRAERGAQKAAERRAPTET